MPRLVIEVERCKGCGLCVAVCPPEVLAMAATLNSRGYHPVELIDEQRCTSCGACALMCPDLALLVFRPFKASRAPQAGTLPA